jgi:hypothetical protein
MIKHLQWVEVWIDSASGGDYVLILRSLADGSLEVIDPQDKSKVVNIFDSYDEATHWLNEDEYDLVEGRWFPFNSTCN